MPIQPKDIERLISEMTARLSRMTESGEVDEWAETNDIDPITLPFISGSLMKTWQAVSIEEQSGPFEILDNIEASIMLAFAVGWESRKEYGGKNET